MIGQKKAFGYRVLNEYFEFVYGATGQKDKGILGELEMGRIQREYCRDGVVQRFDARDRAF